MSLRWNVGSPESVRAQLPSCYSSEFDDCITEAARAKTAGVPPKPSPYCDKYYPVILNSSTVDWDAAMKLMPYCPGGAAPQAKRDTSGIWPALAVIGVVGGILAIVVNTTGSRF